MVLATSLGDITPAQAREILALTRFRTFSRAYWPVASKSQGMIEYKLTRAQRLIDDAYEKQLEDRGYVRLNVLKCRQAGVTTYFTRRAMHHVMMNSAVTALTIAHEQSLPQQWLKRCRIARDMTPACWNPGDEATQGNQLAFANGSRYYIGSAQGGFPGMGDTIHFLHKSECGRWDKPPISLSPSSVLEPLRPAMPTGTNRKGTIDIYESTGVMVGDWWNRHWISCKSDESEYDNLFIPWLMIEEYRDDDHADDVLDLSDYERDLVRIGKSHGIEVDNAQLVWRRMEIRQEPWNGNEDAFRAEYPATEDEAFMSAGGNIYTTEQIDKARQTIREPVWRGNIHGEGSPNGARFEENGSGEAVVWEWPDKRYHYVIGADCQWGTKKEADFDVAFVECLETAKVCAKIKGQFPLNVWGWKLAALGFRYNTAVVAPERNAKAADGLMPLLLGNVSDWHYPNIWIRSSDTKLRGFRPEDYGWWTDNHTKGAAIAMSQVDTLDGAMDWCDRETVDEMSVIIHHEDNSIGSPEGMHDDCWMARLITHAVARREYPQTTLYIEPGSVEYKDADQLRFEALVRELDDETKIPDDDLIAGTQNA